MNIVIKNCNNIDYGELELHEGHLYIKYSINGTGKTTIAKSIAAFSEELREKSPEKYAEYISIILKEIYQDPLRERSNRNDAISISGNDIMEKILSIVQGQIDRNV